MSAPAVGSERNTNDRTVHRNQPSPRPASRPATTPARQPAGSQRPPQRERTNLSAEARGRERSNAGQAIAGFAGSFGSTQGAVATGRVGLGAALRQGERGNGWRTDGDMELNDRQRAALQRVAPLYARDRNQELVVVSGVRGPDRSAHTLLNIPQTERRRLYGGQRAVFDNYERAISESRAQAAREGGGPERVERLLSQRIAMLTSGPNPQYLSGHQRGDSFDLSVTRGEMSTDDIAAATRRFREAGYRVLFEGDHLHIDIPDRNGNVITSANPTITYNEARAINGFQREDEIRAGAPRQPNELVYGDPLLARHRTRPSAGEENSLAARLDLILNAVQGAVPQIP